MIYFIKLLKICAVLFAVKLSVGGVLFLLGPTFFDVDYAIESNIIFIAVYLLVLAKLMAELWVILSLVNVKLLRRNSLSNVLAWLAISCSLIHLVFLYFQAYLGNDVGELFEVMSQDSIKTIILMFLYLYLKKVLHSYSVKG